MRSYTTPLRRSRGTAAGLLAAVLLGLSGLAACTAESGGDVTTEDLQALDEEIGALTERVTVLEDTPPSGSPGATASVHLSESCLAAIRDAEETYAAIDDIGAAARDLDAARLDEIIRALQPLQRRLEENLADCEVDPDVPAEITDGPTPSPSPASPTD